MRYLGEEWAFTKGKIRFEYLMSYEFLIFKIFGGSDGT